MQDLADAIRGGAGTLRVVLGVAELACHGEVTSDVTSASRRPRHNLIVWPQPASDRLCDWGLTLGISGKPARQSSPTSISVPRRKPSASSSQQQAPAPAGGSPAGP